ncbi:hypothetical protein H8959_007860, partial [Pygathrix nigripes]
MNIFRLTGDLSHLAAIVILLLKIWKTRSCAGISGKSQLLFALVFTTRYLDLFTSFISLYNTSMKSATSGLAFLRRRRKLRRKRRRGAQFACPGLGLSVGMRRAPPSLRLRLSADNLVAASGGTFAMPGMVLFGRRWAIASDDLVFPGFFELVVRVLWWIGILTLYLMHRGKLDCAGGALLSSYLIVLMILLAVVIYGVQCDRTVVNGIIATVVVSWIIIAATVVSIIIVFDPLGGKMAPYSSAGPSHLDSHDSSQLLNGLKTAATSVWETRIKLLCCCIGKDDHTRVAFSSTAELFSTYFSDTDLVPSDIAAGLALLHQQQDNIRNNQEPAQVVSHAPGSSQEADLDAELENCHHYMQFAAAAYGWPLYIYRNPLTGLCRIGGDCCRSRTTDYDLVGGDQLNCHFGSILHTTGLQYRDFIHVSFHDKVYELPFIVALDHRKESVVVAVRGTMSLQDVLTDLSAESEVLDVECEVQDRLAHK